MAGVYISYPFCAQKCTFCNFASGVHGSEIQRRYLDLLCQEIASAELTFAPDTVYFGGGTPSSMDPAELDRIFGTLPYRFREATMEAAPGTLSPERVRHWLCRGINRVSLGVQSFVTSELRRTGRRHTAKTVRDDIALLREEGISNFNIDLIAGLPGQTFESWQESLGELEQLRPPHVSVYMFEIDEDSRLGLEVLNDGSRYGAQDLPSEDLTASMYESAVDRLSSVGIERYEISNFAQKGFRSLHNLKYWELAPYRGFGADAHSFEGGLRYQNPDSIEGYLNRRTPLAPVAADASEHLWVGLRLMDGIVPSVEELRTHDLPFRRLVEHGLLEWSGPALRLTRRGVLLSNEVFQEFLPA